MQADGERHKLVLLDGYVAIEKELRQKIDDACSFFLASMVDRHQARLDEVKAYKEAVGKVCVAFGIFLATRLTN